MVASVSFRPQVTMSQPVVKQAEARNFKARLNEVDTDVKNNQISDISAMTQRMQLESKLQDTKVDPVKYVEEIKSHSSERASQGEVVGAVKPSNVTDVIAKFHNGKQPSRVEQAHVLTNQMNMLATSNIILHGLF